MTVFFCVIIILAMLRLVFDDNEIHLRNQFIMLILLCFLGIGMERL